METEVRETMNFDGYMNIVITCWKVPGLERDWCWSINRSPPGAPAHKFCGSCGYSSHEEARADALHNFDESGLRQLGRDHQAFLSVFGLAEEPKDFDWDDWEERTKDEYCHRVSTEDVSELSQGD